MQLPIVASLWVGGPLRFIELLCLKSFVDHGHRTILYSYDLSVDVPDGVELFDARLILPRDEIMRHGPTGSPAIHSYMFRYRLLEVQNVIWTDLDMLCLRPWDFRDQWVFGWQQQGRRVGSAALGLPRFSKTLGKLNGFCRNECPIPPWVGEEETATLERARDAGNPVPITELGLDVWGSAGLTHFLQDTGEGEQVLPESAFFPLPFKRRRLLVEPGYAVDNRLNDESFGMHLWSRRLYRWIDGTLEGQVPAESYLGRALQKHAIDMGVPLKPAALRAPEPDKQTESEPVRPISERVAAAVRLSGSGRMARRQIDPSLPTVATLWIGELSFLEQMCLSSFRDYGHRTVLYTYGEVNGVPEGVEVRDANQVFPNENFIRHKRTGSPAIHADAFRYKMLQTEDVVWVDADMLCLRPWEFADNWIFGWEIQNEQTCNAVLGLPKGSKTLKELNDFCADEYPVPPWADPKEHARLMAAKKAGDPVHVSELKWGVWGPSALTYFLRETGEISHAQHEQAFFPIPFSSRRELLKPGDMIDKRLTDKAYGVHLWNRRLRRKIFADDGGRVDPDSFVGRALIRHGIDPDQAPILDDLKAHQDATAARQQAVAPAPVIQPDVQEGLPMRDVSADEIRKAMRAKPVETAQAMERRPIDPTLPTVAALWIGGTLSFLEQVCLLSFRDFGHRTVLYTYKGVARVPEGIEVRDANKVFPQENYIKHKNSGSPALHSDVFRYWMLKEEDVIWIDADVLCMKPWRFETPFVYGWEKPPRLVCGAVLGLPKDSKTLHALLEFCKDEYPIPPWADDEEKARLQKLHDEGRPEHVTDLKWGVWGPSALTHFLKETGEDKYTLKREAFYPVSFKDRRELLETDVDLSDKIGRGCFGVHLWNRRIRRRIVTHHQGVPEEQSVVGKALTRHRVDPRLAPIPDHPPPGSPTQLELAARKPAGRIAKLRSQTEERAQVYGVNPCNRTPDAAADEELALSAGLTQLDASERKEPKQPAPGAAKTPGAPEPVAATPIEESPENSNNPNVIITPPAALKEMPAMALQQSPEYQQAIDNLEGRTGDITGYLKDPASPIKNEKILVVTSMKNESPFILEWIAYHKSIGVDHFLVYTNDCTDNTDEILDRLDALGHVTRVPNPWDKASGKKPQHVALKDAVKQPCYAAADWILTIDVDEFVNIHVGEGTFDDLFRASNYPNVVSFTWKFFGNKDIHHYEDRPIMEQFVNCAPEFIPKPRLGWGFKSMFHKSSPYTRIGVHRPLGIEDEEADEVRWVNGSGRAMPDMLLTNNGWRSTKRSLGYRLATLNHYILRSTESFLVKRERGRINHTEHDQGVDYWTRRNYATETDDRIHARLPRMQGVLDTFMADKQLARLHKDAVKWHKGRIKSLLGDPDYKQLYDDLTKPGRPDALELAKQAEAAAQAEEASTAETTPRRPKPQINLRAAAPLTTLRMVTPPDSAAHEPLHERFKDASDFSRKIKGFLWEGPENAIMFAPRSKRLVVAFDNISNSREEGQRWPWGFKVLWQDMGCSVLGVMGVQRNWFRHDFVHDAFEALRDQGFFDQFDEILFYGASMGGFGALVYQSCAPGSNVLAIAPQSTLNRTTLANEDRWGWTTKLDWEGRFNDAAPLAHHAKRINIVADPYYKPDYDQVSRITGDNVTWLHTPFMGHQLPNAFVVMNIMKEMLYAAVGDTLTPELFYKLFRARNDLPRFQHDLLMEAERRGKIKSAIRVCEYTLKKRKAQNIKRTLGKLREQLAEMERKEAAE